MKVWAIWQFIKTVAITSLAAVIIWIVSDDVILPIYAGIFLKILATAVFLLGILLAVLKDLKSRKFECTSCHRQFSPDVKNGWDQKCPSCGAPAKCIGRDIPDMR